MTANKEDYLKAIYQEGGQNTLVSNKIIAEKLAISPASVTEMLLKLKKQGLINYEPYKGSTLTNLGLENCIDLIRSHRLWEVFLIQHLGYTWSEAHEDAHLLEHATTKRLIHKLDEFLDYPEFCPHGSAIPGADGMIAKAELIPLSNIKAGESCRIYKVTEEKDLLDYLENAGIKIGETVTVQSIGAYEGSFELRIKGKIIQISHKAACKVFVDL